MISAVNMPSFYTGYTQQQVSEQFTDMMSMVYIPSFYVKTKKKVSNSLQAWPPAVSNCLLHTDVSEVSLMH